MFRLEDRVKLRAGINANPIFYNVIKELPEKGVVTNIKDVCSNFSKINFQYLEIDGSSITYPSDWYELENFITTQFTITGKEQMLNQLKNISKSYSQLPTNILRVYKSDIAKAGLKVGDKVSVVHLADTLYIVKANIKNFKTSNDAFTYRVDTKMNIRINLNNFQLKKENIGKLTIGKNYILAEIK